MTYDLEPERREIMRYLKSMSPAERHELIGDLRVERAIDEAELARMDAGVTYLTLCRFCPAGAVTRCEACDAPLCDDDGFPGAGANGDAIVLCPDCLDS